MVTSVQSFDNFKFILSNGVKSDKCTVRCAV
jgi:hypothetical protein